jgi:hypothetical protein
MTRWVEWIVGWTAGWTLDRTAGWTEALKNNKWTRRATKWGKKTKQNLQRNKENTETRRGERAPAKPHKAAGKSPLRRRLKKKKPRVFFRASLSKQEREVKDFSTQF